MSGLLSNIPGLAAHQVQVPEVTPEPARSDFDREAAFRLVSDAVSLLASFYPAGALEWLRENRPDVIRYLTEAEIALDMAILAEDITQFRVVLEEYVKYHRKAFKIYEERPPVVEVQDDLFRGAA